MDKLIINGQRELHGDVCISGAKNAALPILIASLLSEEELKLKSAELNEIIAETEKEEKSLMADSVKAQKIINPILLK